MISAISLPVVFAAVLWFRIKAHRGGKWRRSVLEAALLLGGGTILGTELLSVARLVLPGVITLGWIFGSAAALLCLWQQLRRPSRVRTRVVVRLRRIRRAGACRDWSRLELATVALVIGATGVIAWLSPPTNYDSMTYQLSRVMHWFQQHSLEHYPTSNTRQLAYGPGAAYWQVQLFSLFDGDRGANLPQWAALVGCVVALTVWLERFFDRRAIGLAVVAGVTLPMAVLQASSTQSDLQVGFWLLVVVVLLTDSARPALGRDALAGLAMGLAIITKPSAVLVLAPLVIVAFFQSLRVRRFTAAFTGGLVWVAVSLAVNLPHFVRNFIWFRHPLGTDFGTLVETWSPGLLAANALRWLGLNVPSFNVWNEITKMLQSTGVEPNDPAITFYFSKFSPTSAEAVHRLLLPDEDFAAYTTTIVLVGLLYVAGRLFSPAKISGEVQSRRPFSGWWLGAVVTGVLLHFMLLKWQWWGNRLLLPSALLGFPLVVALLKLWRHAPVRMACGIALLGQAAFVLVFSLNRPLVALPAGWNYVGAKPLFTDTRENRFYSGYNTGPHGLAEQVVKTVRESGARRIGLYVDANFPEYVIWRALRDAGFKEVEIYHLNVSPPPHRVNIPWPPPVDFSIRLMQPSAVPGGFIP